MVTMTPADPPTLSHTRSRGLASTVEREVKFTIDPDFRLPSSLGSPQPPRLITSTYYDTPSYNLTHAGITLRYRVERGKRAWQLKLPLCHDRQEVEVIDAHRTPPTTPPASLVQLLVLHLRQQHLIPLVTLHVRRVRVAVRRQRRLIAEVSLDTVSALRDGHVVSRFRELEIEWRKASEQETKDIEHLVRHTGARDHDGRPKLFRALSLPSPASAEPPEVDAPVVDHLRWTLNQHVRWLMAHDPGTRLAAESESLHQMRVATRRLRSVLRAARPILPRDWNESLAKELSWLGECLGPARDLDVQIAYFQEERSRLDTADRAPLAQFITYLRSQRAHVQQAVLSELTSVRYFDLVDRLEQAAHHPPVVEATPTKTLRTLAKREFKKLEKTIRSMGTTPDDAALHAIRIKTKRARYAAELARWAAGKAAARFIKQTGKVQDVLGAYQDSVTAEASIRSFVKQSTSVHAAFVAGRLLERQRHRRERLRKELPGLLKTLLKRGKRAWL
ncbi:MAG: CYTH and CHAD domain-containing protein [Nitrospira sp.]|nr:CYTH and CHAD domain-containing protein [Nitrospira sp.]MCP9443004.1 CYTH and CHAD domain-containing protein [Nitrospira sp.]